MPTDAQCAAGKALPPFASSSMISRLQTLGSIHAANPSSTNSTLRKFHMSISMPSSRRKLPQMWWPDDLTEIFRSLARAYCTAAAIAAVLFGRTINDGFRSGLRLCQITPVLHCSNSGASRVTTRPSSASTGRFRPQAVRPNDDASAMVAEPCISCRLSS